VSQSFRSLPFQQFLYAVKVLDDFGNIDAFGRKLAMGNPVAEPMPFDNLPMLFWPSTSPVTVPHR